MQDNIIPFIGGEEEKSEQEPLKIWGHIDNGIIVKREAPVISAQCIRVPVSDGHLAAVFVSFEKKPEREEILARWKEFRGKPQILGLPHAPEQFITYMEEDNRPQTRLDPQIYAEEWVSPQEGFAVTTLCTGGLSDFLTIHFVERQEVRFSEPSFLRRRAL